MRSTSAGFRHPRKARSTLALIASTVDAISAGLTSAKITPRVRFRRYQPHRSVSRIAPPRAAVTAKDLEPPSTPETSAPSSSISRKDCPERSARFRSSTSIFTKCDSAAHARRVSNCAADGIGAADAVFALPQRLRTFRSLPGATEGLKLLMLILRRTA